MAGVDCERQCFGRSVRVGVRPKQIVYSAPIFTYGVFHDVGADWHVSLYCGFAIDEKCDDGGVRRLVLEFYKVICPCARGER